MVGGRGNESLPFCVDWHHFGTISGTCVSVHQNHGHTTPCFQMETFFQRQSDFVELCSISNWLNQIVWWDKRYQCKFIVHIFLEWCLHVIGNRLQFSIFYEQWWFLMPLQDLRGGKKDSEINALPHPKTISIPPLQMGSHEQRCHYC